MQDQASRTEPVAEVWIYAVLGVISILFGLALIFFPRLTLTAFVLLFGIYAIVFGIAYLVAMFRRISHHHTWWPQLIIELAGLAAGIYVFVFPGNHGPHPRLRYRVLGDHYRTSADLRGPGNR